MCVAFGVQCGVRARCSVPRHRLRSANFGGEALQAVGRERTPAKAERVRVRRQLFTIRHCHHTRGGWPRVRSVVLLGAVVAYFYMNLDDAIFKTSIYTRAPGPVTEECRIAMRMYVYIHSDGAYIIIAEASYI